MIGLRSQSQVNHWRDLFNTSLEKKDGSERKKRVREMKKRKGENEKEEEVEEN